eukprot:TRINITY_DN10266_c0_g1_i1.p1 TRINITY_DN10266_c0_g1~~TRINITY_DN10266_c0_g1_i1.p1  ORF type:complete len:486 (+),score=118.31 TRINITY_DN10266_c0_g1_i1:142-1458(+)
MTLAAKVTALRQVLLEIESCITRNQYEYQQKKKKPKQTLQADLCSEIIRGKKITEESLITVPRELVIFAKDLQKIEAQKIQGKGGSSAAITLEEEEFNAEAWLVDVQLKDNNGNNQTSIAPANQEKSGYLRKLGNLRQKWDLRWFVLDAVNGCLKYWTNHEDCIAGKKERGRIELYLKGGVRVERMMNGMGAARAYSLEIRTTARSWLLEAETEESIQSWIEAIKHILDDGVFVPTTVSTLDNDDFIVLAEEEGEEEQKEKGEEREDEEGKNARLKNSDSVPHGTRKDSSTDAPKKKRVRAKREPKTNKVDETGGAVGNADSLLPMRRGETKVPTKKKRVRPARSKKGATLAKSRAVAAEETVLERPAPRETERKKKDMKLPKVSSDKKETKPSKAPGKKKAKGKSEKSTSSQKKSKKADKKKRSKRSKKRTIVTDAI